VPQPDDSLDSLALRAQAGDREAEERLFAELRVRFAAVAKRRVRPEELEDVVQETLRVVLTRHAGRPRESGILPWSYAVLRNVIGNCYQRRRRGVIHLPPGGETPAELRIAPGAAGEDPLEELDRSQVVRALDRALAVLGRQHPRCAVLFQAILRALVEGGGSRSVSTRALVLAREALPDLSSTSFYVALHRCRARLREHYGSLDEAGAS
jgi:DNA-directed RNA polymerase specialized sigma24 family protein